MVNTNLSDTYSKRMFGLFEDGKIAFPPSPNFLNIFQPETIKNPDRRCWQFWKPKFIKNPDYVDEEIEIDIIRVNAKNLNAIRE